MLYCNILQSTFTDLVLV